MPGRLQLMVLLAAWCGLRFGELAELRRADVDLAHGVLRVRRGVRPGRGPARSQEPRSPRPGIRDVAIPPHLMPMVHDHLIEHAGRGRARCCSPPLAGGHLTPGGLYDGYYPARQAAGRPDLRFHDLRHTGATLAAATGATLAELMRRLGHSTRAGGDAATSTPPTTGTRPLPPRCRSSTPPKAVTLRPGRSARKEA